LNILRKIIERGLTKKQRLILNELSINGYYLTLSSFLDSLARKYEISPSTLRWNIGILSSLGLIVWEKSKPIRLTKIGKLILKILGEGEENKR